GLEDLSSKVQYLEGVLHAMEETNAAQRDTMMDVINASKQIVTAQVKSMQKILELKDQVKKLSDKMERMEEGTKRRIFSLHISSSEDEMEDDINDKGDESGGNKDSHD
ncbi:hypothetical protein KI387_030657, partial [Taxus chinensis]